LAKNEHLADNGVIFIENDLPYPDFNFITKKNSPIDVFLTGNWRRTGVIFRILMSFYVWSVISACIYDVKTGFYDVTYINGWCHFNENDVTFYIWS